MIGGAVRTERPFAKVPDLLRIHGCVPSRSDAAGAHAGARHRPAAASPRPALLPPDDRGPLPAVRGRRGGDARQFTSFFSEPTIARTARSRASSLLRDDIAPTWLTEPLSIEDTADRYVRTELRLVSSIARKPIRDYLERFGFESDLIKAMYAVTDAFSGLAGTWDTPGTGMNFLVHNMCRLPGSDGTWMIVRGGMGTVTARLDEAARRAAATIETNAVSAAHRGPRRRGRVRRARGRTQVRARVVVANADPFRMRALVGREPFPETTTPGSMATRATERRSS